MEQEEIDREIMLIANTSPSLRAPFNKVFADLVKHYDEPLLGSNILKLYPIVDVTEAFLLSKYLKIYLDDDLIHDFAKEIFDMHERSAYRRDIFFDNDEPITVQKISDYYDFPILLARKVFETLINIEDDYYYAEEN